MSTFHFKQFSVQNEKSAMKVNTDSVLLGAWAKIPEEAKTGIDIGSGTGILALMFAQKNSEIELTGVEIEKKAFEESKLNFKNSPYQKRLRAVNLPLQEFIAETKFDCIITNPPYFENDLKNEDENKKTARHTVSLSFIELINFAENNLSDMGSFSLVLPFTESEIFRNIAENSALFLTRIAFIKPNEKKEINRVLMTFSLTGKKLEKETFCVYQSHQIYSERHHELTRDFYLDK
ncbi:MAG: methyltransferase [Flavobacteriales bacterium]